MDEWFGFTHYQSCVWAIGILSVCNTPTTHTHTQSAELALREFQTILEDYHSMHFVPAHWGAARALVLLHRHSRALLTARNGLEQLPLVKLPSNFTWPGTSNIMTEALVQNVEVMLTTCAL